MYRKKGWTVPLLSGLFLVLTPCALRAESAPGKAEGLQAEYRRGREAMASGRWDEAYQVFSRLWAERQTYDVALNLAQTELNLGRYADAAQHIAFGLRTSPVSSSPEMLERARKGLEQARAHVGWVKIEVDQEGAEVLVDTKPIGISPLSDEVYLAPGLHQVEARKGDAQARAEVRAEAGQGGKLELRLASGTGAAGTGSAASGVSGVSSGLGADEPGRGGSAAPVDADRAEGGSEPGPGSYLRVLVAGSVALAGIATGVGCLVVASGKDSDRERELLRLSRASGQNPCATGSPSPDACESIENAAESAERYRGLAYLGFGVGLVGAGATYFLWPRVGSRRGSEPGSEQARQTRTLLPLAWVSGRGAGLTMAGRF